MLSKTCSQTVVWAHYSLNSYEFGPTHHLPVHFLGSIRSYTVGPLFRGASSTFVKMSRPATLICWSRHSLTTSTFSLGFPSSDTPVDSIQFLWESELTADYELIILICVAIIGPPAHITISTSAWLILSIIQ